MNDTKEISTVERTYCPLCRSKNRSILLNTTHNSPRFLNFIKNEPFFTESLYDNYHNGPLKELLFEIAECNDCHFIYLTQVLNDKGMELLYNEWMDKNLLKEYYDTIPRGYFENAMLTIIKKKVLKKKHEVTLMDFGAGYGQFCSKAVKLGYKTYAFDLSADKNDTLDNLGVMVINNLENYHGYFDFIYVNQVLEHLTDPQGTLKNLERSLSADGIIYIGTPDVTGIQKIIKEKGLSPELHEFISPHQHINGFTNNTLCLLAKNEGLQPLSLIDFVKLFNTSFNFHELKFLIKKTLRSLHSKTTVFFKKS